MGDFNVASPTWGYSYYNGEGKIVEDFINNNPTQLLYNQNDPGTIIHYSGAKTNPDLAMVSSCLFGPAREG